MEKVLQIEAFEKSLDEICEMDSQMESVANLHEKKLIELDAHISKYSSEIISFKSEAAKIQSEFWTAVQILIPSVNKTASAYLPEIEQQIEQLFEKLRAKGARLSALRADRVFNEFNSVLNDSSAYSPPKLEFGDVLNLALKAAQTLKTRNVESDSD